ncbi:MAG: hypothetical protein HZC41_07665 [Chloroflexi bacterium]|nr:hypothetical protein [Chloroflexota bacterium]
MQLDRVVSRLPDGFEHVCTLVLRDFGLYVLHTGSVEDLPGYLPNHTSENGLTEIEKSERRIEQTPLSELAVEERSAFVDAGDIHDVNLTTENLSPDVAVPVVEFQTSINQYRFLFPYMPLEQVQAFSEALKQTVRAAT